MAAGAACVDAWQGLDKLLAEIHATCLLSLNYCHLP